MRLRAQRGTQHSSARNIGSHMLRATYPGASGATCVEVVPANPARLIVAAWSRGGARGRPVESRGIRANRRVFVRSSAGGPTRQPSTLGSERTVLVQRSSIPDVGTLVFPFDDRIDVDRQLIGKHELAVHDLHAWTERRAARGVADCEEQIAARLEDVVEQITRLGNRCRPPKRPTALRPASLASPTHHEESTTSSKSPSSP